MAKAFTYKIKEIFYTLQGEGAQSGRPAVFCRFTGCNLWSGREEDRHKAICKFCDTDFWGTDGVRGGKYTAHKLCETILSLWPQSNSQRPYVVCTGGEPLLQLDQYLVTAMHQQGLEIAVETNGTILPPDKLDWICVSPKANTKLQLTTGNELKLVHPQIGISPESFIHLNFEHFYLQPMDGENTRQNQDQCIQYCLENPKWKLSLQTHKIVGLQ